MSAMNFTSGGGGGTAADDFEEDDEEPTEPPESNFDADYSAEEQASSTDSGTSGSTTFTQGDSTTEYWDSVTDVGSQVEGQTEDDVTSATLESEGTSGEFGLTGITYGTEQGDLDRTEDTGKLFLGGDGSGYYTDFTETDVADNDPTNEDVVIDQQTRDNAEYYKENVARQNARLNALQEQLGMATNAAQRANIRAQIAQAQAGGGGAPNITIEDSGGGGGSDGVLGTGISGRQAAAGAAVAGGGLGVALLLGVI